MLITFITSEISAKCQLKLPLHLRGKAAYTITSDGG